MDKNSNLEAEIENLKKSNEIIVQEKKEMEQRLLNGLKQKQIELNHEKKIHYGVIAKNEILERQIEIFEKQESHRTQDQAHENNELQNEISQLRNQLAGYQSQLRKSELDQQETSYIQEQQFKTEVIKMHKAIEDLEVQLRDQSRQTNMWKD